LKIEKQNLDDHQVKLVVEADENELASAKAKAARSIAKRVKIPGFRPGKAPYHVIERQVGAGTILEDALEILAQELYPQAIEEIGLKPYGPGSLESIANVEPPTFEFVIPLQAEIELGDYQAVKIPYDPEEVTEDEITDALNNLRDRHAVVEPVERVAQTGDLVRIQLSAERIEPEADQDPVLINQRELPVIIEPDGQDNEHEWPFPGFSRELSGLAVGATKDLEYTFADDSHYESLQGTKARFHIQVDQVSGRELPELDDEFALTASEYETLDELKTAIASELADAKLSDYHRDYDDQVIEKILTEATLKYPPQMVDRELEDMLYDLQNRLAQQGLDLETYLRINQKTEEDVRIEFRDAAVNRLERSLILFELARREDIEVSEQEVQSETIGTLNALSQSFSQEEMQKLTSQEQMQNLVSSIMADMLVRKTITHMRALASDNKSLPVETSEEIDTTAELPDDGEKAESDESVEETSPVTAASEGTGQENDAGEGELEDQQDETSEELEVETD
jgi:trigger factor